MKISLERQDFILKLKGDVIFDTVMKFRKMGENCIVGSSKLSFDFSEVGRCDSSALALLIAWKRLANVEGAQIEFINLPRSLKVLSELCNVKSLLQM